MLRISVASHRVGDSLQDNVIVDIGDYGRIGISSLDISHSYFHNYVEIVGSDAIIVYKYHNRPSLSHHSVDLG